MLGRSAPPVVAMGPKAGREVAETQHMQACLALALPQKLAVA